MAPVRQQRGDEDIGHTGQVGRPWQHLMMIEDAVKKDGLCEKEQEGQQGIKESHMTEQGIQDIQDQPVQGIIVGSRLQCRSYRVQEEGKLQYQCID